MNKSLLTALLFSTIAGFGCSKSEETAPAPKNKTFVIEEIGVSIDAPENWKLEKNMDRFYSLEGPKAQVQIMASRMSGDSLEDMAKSCSKGVLEKEMLAGGANYVLCKGHQAGIDTKGVRVEVATGESTSVRCHFETDKDPATIISVCKSLKKL